MFANRVRESTIACVDLPPAALAPPMAACQKECKLNRDALLVVVALLVITSLHDAPAAVWAGSERICRTRPTVLRMAVYAARSEETTPSSLAGAKASRSHLRPSVVAWGDGQFVRWQPVSLDCRTAGR